MLLPDETAVAAAAMRVLRPFDCSGDANEKMSYARSMEILAANLSEVHAFKPPNILERHSYQDGESKPDCVEMLLRELFDLLLYNPATQTFEVERLPTSALPELLRHYQQRNSGELLPEDAGAAWFPLCQDHTGTCKYISSAPSGGAYELHPTLSNLSAAAGVLLGRSDDNLDSLRSVQAYWNGVHLHERSGSEAQPIKLIIDESGIRSQMPFQQVAPRFCVFEYVYFSRPDSIVEGRGVYHARKAIGGELASESHIDADLIIPVPDSGVPAALGYAEKSGVPFDLGIIRNHYVGRTFIQPTQKGRTDSVKLKHNANPAAVKGKRIVLVDDSIVRGTTSRKIVTMMRNAGAAEVHMRIASPPTTHPCFYGVDTPSQDQLIAARMTVDEIAAEIGVDSLAFITVDGMYKAIGDMARNEDQPQFCDACFTGDYPIRLASGLSAKRVSHGGSQ